MVESQVGREGLETLAASSHCRLLLEVDLDGSDRLQQATLGVAWAGKGVFALGTKRTQSPLTYSAKRAAACSRFFLK